MVIVSLFHYLCIYIINIIKICKNCDFKTKNNIQFKEHNLNYHSNKEEREKEFKYYCKYCDYGTFAVSFIEKHNNTIKHKRHMNIVDNLKY